MNDFVKELEIYALATDPIYIGTGGYTIGRVDNTIVRDPITSVPKIPGSSLAGTWRYYVVLEIINKWKNLISNLNDKKSELLESIKSLIDQYEWLNNEDEKNRLKQSINLDNIDKTTPRNFIVQLIEQIGLKFEKDDDKDKKSKKFQKQEEIFEELLSKLGGNNFEDLKFTGNRFLQITCAGQDNVPQEELSNSPFATNKDGKTGHCGHCIVCKGFGFSKKDVSWQGMIFFSDLNILFFPVFTMKGTRWITTASRLKEAGICSETEPVDNKIRINEADKDGTKYLNLGWLYLKVDEQYHKISKDKLLKFKFDNKFDSKPDNESNNYFLEPKDIVIVPENLFSQIVNSNLEVRTSVSIDPITGAAKEGALFTSEAIPRGTIFYGKIRIFDKKTFEGIRNELEPLPNKEQLICALKDSKHFYETLGIGGMTTRGFGRMKINLWCKDEITGEEGFVICSEDAQVESKKEEQDGNSGSQS